MINTAKLLCADTTIIYFKLHGHSIHKKAVAEASSGKQIVVSNFVRGEYIRGYIIGLIELHALLKEEYSVDDAFVMFSAEAGKRSIGNALQSVVGWLRGLENWDDRSATLRRLGEFIRQRLDDFDLRFPSRVFDPLACDFGVMSFPRDSYRDEQIYEFLAEHDRIRETPGCRQCEFREEKRVSLASAGIDLHSQSQRDANKEFKGYVDQAKWIEKSLRSPKTAPSCWYCDRLGDTIITLSSPDGVTILTGDGQSYPVLAKLVGKSIHLIPSIKAIRSQPGPIQDQ